MAINQPVSSGCFSSGGETRRFFLCKREGYVSMVKKLPCNPAEKYRFLIMLTLLYHPNWDLKFDVQKIELFPHLPSLRNFSF
jgi:hypothetical protein